MAWYEESKLALEAVTSSLKLFHDKSESIITSEKYTSRDIVTKFDLKIEDYIIKFLEDTGYKIIGEEKRNTIPKFEDDRIYWVIDPIDGTVNFVHHLHYYGIAVGLCRISNQIVDPLIGAFCMPETKDLFFMEGDQISYWNGKRLKSMDCKLKNSLIVCCLSSRSNDIELREREYITLGEINDFSRGVLRIGSASTAICYTSASKYQVTYGLNIPIWDVIAGLAIAKVAGFKCLTKFNSKTQRLNFIIGVDSATQEVHNILEKNNLWEN